jgi:lipopolysaccharide/colanic/teichoic acid biosynthesis glycosyltransferase
MRKETFYEKYIKRSIDFCGACAALVVTAIPMAATAVAVRVKLGSPVLYSATRIGKNEKPFKMYKFRSMTNEKDENGNLLPDAERMTKLGNFIRSTSLDELPELFAILKGDMAFIGPRPERKYFIDQIMEHDPRYELLYAIRPGVTSYATLHNGYTDTMEKMLTRLKMDLYYLEHQSLWMDIKILWYTFANIVSGKIF